MYVRCMCGMYVRDVCAGCMCDVCAVMYVRDVCIEIEALAALDVVGLWGFAVNPAWAQG